MVGLTKYDLINKKLVSFNRNEGYRLVNGFKVRKSSDIVSDRKVSLKLYNLQKKVDIMIRKNLVMGQLRLDTKINKILSREKNRWVLEGLNIMKEMHYKKEGGLSEIPPGRFRGINYPLGVNMTDKIPISRDGQLRAKNRQIYLTIRNISEEDIINTLIHELAHTLSNDVIYYEKHTPQFYTAEKVIKLMWENSGNYKYYE